MRLRPVVRAVPPVPVRLKPPGELHAAPARYAEYDRHEQGTAIEVPDLVVEMVRTFLATDRDFRAWQRDGRGQGAGPSGGRGAVE